MKTRTVQDIRKELETVNRRLRQLQIHGDDAMSEFDLRMGHHADSAIRSLKTFILHDEQELREATRFGEQLSLKF